jgi:hippurate hydrolase
VRSYPSRTPSFFFSFKETGMIGLSLSRCVGIVAAATIGACPTMAAAAPLDAKAVGAEIQRKLDADYPQLDALYKDIHSHPEVAFHEVRTAALLAKQMRNIGFAVTEKVGGTGLVALYRNGPGPVIMVRTELDALPMEEKTGLSYASRTPGVAHACGHDAHMAWWVGTARILVAMKEKWHGTLMFVAQPAEEVLSGAKAMLKDGLFTRFPKPDYSFAAHVDPIPAGTIVIKDGVFTSSSTSMAITFHGRGAHGSMPSESIDPVVMGAHFVSDLQSVVSREKDAAAFGVVTVGSFQAGTTAGIIPDHADLKLSVRANSPEVKHKLLDGVNRTANAITAMAGAPDSEITYLAEVDEINNDSKIAEQAENLLRSLLGNQVIFKSKNDRPHPASDDYSLFVKEGIPSLYYTIGSTDPKVIAEAKAKGTSVPVHHSPFFAPVPEPTIKAGVTALSLSVLMVAD